MQWEYKVISTSSWAFTVSQELSEAEQALNYLGRDGWELVSVRDQCFFLKRRLNQ